MIPLVVVGAGGFGREVLDIVEAAGTASEVRLVGVIDDHPSAANLDLLERRGVPYLGSVQGWLTSADTSSFVVGVANPAHRRLIDEQMTAAGHTSATLVHPAASLGSEVSVGPGAIICAGARLTTNIDLGRHVHVHVNSTIGHDTSLGDYVSTYPLSAVSGSCRLAAGATIGAHATVLQGLTIGADAFVGAGAVVVADVPPHSIVKGVPAR